MMCYNKDDVEGRLFENHRKKIKMIRSILVMFIVFAMGGYLQVSAQKQIVSGTVTDQGFGRPMAGVKVMLADSSMVTVTNADGRYDILVPPQGSILFVSPGYIPVKRDIAGQSTLDVVMEGDIQELVELLDMVLVGYGAQKRTGLSTAQTSLDATAINRTFNGTVEQALQGRADAYVVANSTQPGGSMSVYIRGVNSINGNTEPLYVIDGVQISATDPFYKAGIFQANGLAGIGVMSPLSGINPKDVESIEVLQGPSATSIYGSRATNGVVLITTKRGTSGPMRVGYQVQAGVQTVNRLMPVMNLPQYATFLNDVYTISGLTPREELGDVNALSDGTSWQKSLFRNAGVQQHHLTLQGGNEKTNYYASGEYFKQQGVVPASGLTRGGFRMNVDHQANDWLKFSGTLGLSQTSDLLGAASENLVSSAIALAPDILVKNGDGSWGGADAINGYHLQHTPLNPVALGGYLHNIAKRRQAIGGIAVDARLWKGLSFRSSLNGNILNANLDYFIPDYSVGAQQFNDSFMSAIDGSQEYWNWNQLLNYEHTQGRHEVNVMLSHEAQATSFHAVNAARRSFVTTDIIDLNMGSLGTATNESDRQFWSMESYFSRVNYSYHGRYFLQAGLRADGSSNFGPGHRWGVFPSVSAAWRISEESFMKSVSFVNDLKLRLETGRTGNQGTGGVYNTLGPVTTSWGSGFAPSQYGNANLKWEQTEAYNLGLNAALFNNRVRLEGDIYFKRTNNLLMRSSLPGYLGTKGAGSVMSPMENASVLENRGFSIKLTTTNIEHGEFLWTTDFNVSGFQSKVAKLYSGTSVVERSFWYINGLQQQSVPGSSPLQFIGYQSDGLFQSIADINASPLPPDFAGNRPVPGIYSVWVGDEKFRDTNGDGIIDEKDKTAIGSPWPKLVLGMTQSFHYKNFDLGLLFTGVYGNDILNFDRYERMHANPSTINYGSNFYREQMDFARVGTDANGNPYIMNPGTNVPRITWANDGRLSSRFIEDGSYIRLKNVQLSYTMPERITRQLKYVHAIKVSGMVQNVFTLTRYKGFDPEVGQYTGQHISGAGNPVGVDYSHYPLARQYSLSLYVEF